ncbi:MAG: SpoIIE family protein phosphatase [Planctomycetota bacterium]|nr:SpoIIE family protein phosphatase [Planctomycetota bacterium]
MEDPGKLIEALEKDLARQRQLVQASYALHSSLDLGELLGLILKAASDGVGAERGTVFLVDPTANILWSRVLSGDEALEISLPIGQGLAGSVAATGETVRLADAYDDERFDRSWDQQTGFRTRQMLCAPIRNRHGEVVGVFQLLNRTSGNFTEQDEEYLEQLSVNAALAIENAQLHKSALEKERYDREVRLAQDMQRQLQPEKRLRRDGVLEVAGLNELCEDATGDYYDLLLDLPRDRIGVAIGDVSGHGLQAALVMAEARAFLRAFVQTTPELPKAMDLINDFLVPDMKDGKFISLFAAVIDSGDGGMEWCNAGHNPPLLFRAATGAITRLAATGRILGILPDAAYRAGETSHLAHGDVLFLYTDGVTEARSPDGDLLGEDRLESMLRDAAEGSAEEIVATVRLAVRDWTAGGANDDDLTIVAVKHV